MQSSSLLLVGRWLVVFHMCLCELNGRNIWMILSAKLVLSLLAVSFFVNSMCQIENRSLAWSCIHQLIWIADDYRDWSSGFSDRRTYWLELTFRVSIDLILKEIYFSWKFISSFRVFIPTELERHPITIYAYSIWNAIF